MKIKSFNFSNNKNWCIEEIYFDSLNLLVGASGVGKTRILRALDLICDVAKDTERELDNIEWVINFSHLSKDYKWELKTASSVDEVFPGELGKAEILYERLAECRDNEEIEILYRSGTDSKLDDKPLPKLKRSESAITLLAEEESIAPIAKAFKRFVFNETPQRAFFSFPFDPSSVSLSSDPNGDLEKFKESVVNVPTVFKSYLIQQLFPNVFNEVKESYFEIFSDVQDVRVSINKESVNDYQLIFEIQEYSSSDWIPQNRISSGMYRTLICLLEIIAAPNGSVIVIDEFENSLGINCMPELTNFILDKSPDLQFILTSHHPYIINNLPWQTWQVVSRSGSSIKATKATDISALDTASSLDKFTQLINFIQ